MLQYLHSPYLMWDGKGKKKWYLRLEEIFENKAQLINNEEGKLLRSIEGA